MKATTLARAVIPLFAGYFFALPAFAQEGHPMSGVWVGDWGMNAQQRSRVVIVLEWEDTELSGTINPGPNAVPVKVATADPSDWSLHLEADTTDSNGRPANWVIDGKLNDLGTYNRTIEGTWKAGNDQGTFSITRQ